ncbi:hypothetical protein C4D60_Mb02t03390 [Musa balbisiana]|uniref:Protein kinase domain-containing protein n=1 Tax=Musa balbisiana TaxID=52838 RepID=A0A4S8I872_MUSBA|nr:hypothetical protein C4D60_Mb02t03390 [Musa balbisiana]
MSIQPSLRPSRPSNVLNLLHTSASYGYIPGIEGVNIYTYKELKIATDDFSAANKVGEGGFGSVYRGMLKDGTVVAIKVLSSESKQGVGEFLTEIKVISGIIHENLVKLYGCCAEEPHRILVYNYLENNSLSQTLLGSIIPVYTTKFEFFVHLGYLAPEYAIRGQVTRKSDVYSYGVLLLEIVTGRCNTNTRLPFEDRFLLERTWAIYEHGDLKHIIDSSLTDDLDVEEACRFLKVGLLCTQDAMKLRPSMSTVIMMLTGEKDVDLEKITKPGIISNFMDLKVGSKKKADQTNRSLIMSSILENSPLSSENTTSASMTFTAISE